MQEKEIRGIQIRQEEIKLFADEMIAYLENIKDLPKKKVLKLACEFNNVTGYTKINRFLDTNNEHTNTEIKNTSFIVPQKIQIRYKSKKIYIRFVC